MSADESDIEYCLRRAEQELAAAQQSMIEEAVAAHYQLAELYLEEVARLTGANGIAAGEDARSDAVADRHPEGGRATTIFD